MLEDFEGVIKMRNAEYGVEYRFNPYSLSSTSISKLKYIGPALDIKKNIELVFGENDGGCDIFGYPGQDDPMNSPFALGIGINPNKLQVTRYIFTDAGKIYKKFGRNKQIRGFSTIEQFLRQTECEPGVTEFLRGIVASAEKYSIKK